MERKDEGNSIENGSKHKKITINSRNYYEMKGRFFKSKSVLFLMLTTVNPFSKGIYQFMFRENGRYLLIRTKRRNIFCFVIGELF